MSGNCFDNFWKVGYTLPHGMQSSILTMSTEYFGARATHGVYSAAVIVVKFILFFAELNIAKVVLCIR